MAQPEVVGRDCARPLSLSSVSPARYRPLRRLGQPSAAPSQEPSRAKGEAECSRRFRNYMDGKKLTTVYLCGRNPGGVVRLIGRDQPLVGAPIDTMMLEMSMMPEASSSVVKGKVAAVLKSPKRAGSCFKTCTKVSVTGLYFHTLSLWEKNRRPLREKPNHPDLRRGYRTCFALRCRRGAGQSSPRHRDW